MGKLDRKLRKGYQRLNKDRFIIGRMLNLTDAEFRLYEFYLAVYDWDERHFETFGTIEASDSEIGKYMGWSRSKTYRNRKSLIRKGFLKEIESGIYEINTLFEYKSKLSSPHKVIAKLEPQNSYEEQVVAKLHQEQLQKDDSSLVSYKGNVVSFDNNEDDKDMPF